MQVLLHIWEKLKSNGAKHSKYDGYDYSVCLVRSMTYVTGHCCEEKWHLPPILPFLFLALASRSFFIKFPWCSPVIVLPLWRKLTSRMPFSSQKIVAITIAVKACTLNSLGHVDCSCFLCFNFCSICFVYLRRFSFCYVPMTLAGEKRPSYGQLDRLSVLQKRGACTMSSWRFFLNNQYFSEQLSDDKTAHLSYSCVDIVMVPYFSGAWIGKWISLYEGWLKRNAQ